MLFEKAYKIKQYLICPNLGIKLAEGCRQIRSQVFSSNLITILFIESPDELICPNLAY